MKRSLLHVVFSVLCLIAVMGSLSAAGVIDHDPGRIEEGFPLTFVDDLGHEVTLNRRPETVISLTSFSDEVLFEILPIESFAAVSSLSRNRGYSNVVEKALMVEPVIEFNVEQIIHLYPDLVITANWSEASKVEQLRKAGLTVYQIDTPFDIDGIKRSIRALGRLTGAEDPAEELIRSIDLRVSRLEEQVAAVPENRRVSALDYSSWGVSNGAGTTWNLVLSLAGIDNAAGHLEPGDFGQVQLSKEMLISLDPDALFLPSYVWGDDDAAGAFYRQVLNDPALSGLSAISGDRVFIFPERLKNSYSHYLIEAAEEAARMAYPGLLSSP